MPIGHYKISKLLLKTSQKCEVFYVIQIFIIKNRPGATNTKAM
nr:MAG TPA: hypothetical protein [Caudoviricetes sp.]